MITTTLAWYSLEEKLPSETDNIMFVTKAGNLNLEILKGYYSESCKVFIEEDIHLADVSSWKHEEVAYWAVVDYSTFYSQFDQKLLGVEA